MSTEVRYGGTITYGNGETRPIQYRLVEVSRQRWWRKARYVVETDFSKWGPMSYWAARRIFDTIRGDCATNCNAPAVSPAKEGSRP